MPRSMTLAACTMFRYAETKQRSRGQRARYSTLYTFGLWYARYASICNDLHGKCNDDFVGKPIGTVLSALFDDDTHDVLRFAR